jgi:hypothetical protein
MVIWCLQDRNCAALDADRSLASVYAYCSLTSHAFDLSSSSQYSWKMGWPHSHYLHAHGVMQIIFEVDWSPASKNNAGCRMTSYVELLTITPFIVFSLSTLIRVGSLVDSTNYTMGEFFGHI